MIVSRVYLDALREHKPLPPPSLELRPDVATVNIVHQQLDTQHCQAVLRGEKTLSLAHTEMQLALNKARKEGWTRSHFNKVSHTDECKP